MCAQRDRPALACTTATTIIEQNVIARSIEKARPGQHIGPRPLETMHQNDRRSLWRSNSLPARKFNAIARVKLDLLDWQIGWLGRSRTMGGIGDQAKTTQCR